MTSIIGYGRVSTTHQNEQPQIEALTKAGCEKIFIDKASGSSTNRKKLQEMNEYVREGDTIIVTKLDRVARSTIDLLNLIKSYEEKSVNLKVLNMELDTSTAQGKLLVNLLGSIAEFELSLQKERQKEGIEAAKAKGKYKGRKPTVKAQKEEMLQLLEDGYSKPKIAKKLGVAVSSVYRILKEK